MDVVDVLRKKIKICKMGAESAWQDGYIKGLEDAIPVIMAEKISMILPGRAYYCIVYMDGNKNIPYIQRMKLFHIYETLKRDGTKMRIYAFSLNMEATRFNTKRREAHLMLSKEKDLYERVFFTHDKAEERVMAIEGE